MKNIIILILLLIPISLFAQSKKELRQQKREGLREKQEQAWNLKRGMAKSNIKNVYIHNPNGSSEEAGDYLQKASNKMLSGTVLKY